MRLRSALEVAGSFLSLGLKEVEWTPISEQRSSQQRVRRHWGDAWRFAQTLLGNVVPSDFAFVEQYQAERARLEWLAEVSTRNQGQLQDVVNSQMTATADSECVSWVAECTTLQEAHWDAAKHPRRGAPPNAGWFATTGGTSSPSGAGGSAGAGRPPSLFDAVIRRNSAVADLTGTVTPGMVRSNRLAADLQSAARLPRQVSPAAAAGLGTGGKAVVNASATAVKNVATLGLSSSQLVLIGVTDEDRERGYDTAVTIATASGEVLIAVGTGGIGSALSKGGTVARVAGGALVAFDAAGNAVGVVQGTYDATQNGVSLRSGAQVAAGALGLGANLNAAGGLKSSNLTKQAVPGKPAPNVHEFVATVPRTATPTKTPANQYEIKHTGPYNYTVSGGGATFDVDGFRGSTILEAKHVGKPNDSPYVPGSSCPDKVRAEILEDVRDELRRARTIIESGSTPFQSVEIITNSSESKALFEGMLQELSVPGTVRLEQ